MAEAPRSNRPTPRTAASVEAELRRRIRTELEQARAAADGELADVELAAIIARAVASALQWHLEAPEHTRNATLSSRSWRPAGGPRGPRPREDRDFDRPPRDREFDRPPRDREFDRPPRDREFDRPPRDREFDRPPRDREFDRGPRERDYDRPPRERPFDRPPREFERREPDYGRRDRPEGNYDRPPRDRDFDRPRRPAGKPFRGGGFKARSQRRPPRSR